MKVYRDTDGRDFERIEDAIAVGVDKILHTHPDCGGPPTYSATETHLIVELPLSKDRPTPKVSYVFNVVKIDVPSRMNTKRIQLALVKHRSYMSRRNYDDLISVDFFKALKQVTDDIGGSVHFTRTTDSLRDSLETMICTIRRRGLHTMALPLEQIFVEISRGRKNR